MKMIYKYFFFDNTLVIGNGGGIDGDATYKTNKKEASQKFPSSLDGHMLGHNCLHVRITESCRKF